MYIWLSVVACISWYLYNDLHIVKELMYFVMFFKHIAWVETLGWYTGVFLWWAKHIYDKRCKLLQFNTELFGYFLEKVELWNKGCIIMRIWTLILTLVERKRLCLKNHYGIRYCAVIGVMVNLLSVLDFYAICSSFTFIVNEL